MNVIENEICLNKNLSSGFPTRSGTKRAVHPQTMEGCLIFRIYNVDGLYFLCSENTGVDHMCGYRAANLRLCFRISKKTGFLVTPMMSTCISLHFDNTPMKYTDILMAVKMTIFRFFLIFAKNIDCWYMVEPPH